MSFTSLTFIYYFIPAFFLLFYFLKKGRSYIAVIFSLLFCAWGDLRSLWVLMGICTATWLFGIKASKSKGWMRAGIVTDLCALAFFKVFPAAVILPAGISFYVFHGISYLVDVNKRGNAAKPMCFAVYMTFFPKLIMGPIISFDDFELQYGRFSEKIDPDHSADGMFLFAIGLAKKALIAGPLGIASEALWDDASSAALSAWLALICFGLQLYYDFSSYSDMARGLGSMCGFDFPVNFDHPYMSRSVSEFWRRWHITLGAWFKKYIYFPMGGSRKGEGRTYLNLIVVWLCTGMWHGDTLSYLIWGLGLGLVICFEKKTRLIENMPALLSWLWTMAWIFSGWVFFNTENFADAMLFFKYLYSGVDLKISIVLGRTFHDYWAVILAAVIGASPVVSNTIETLTNKKRSLAKDMIKAALTGLLMAISTVLIVNSGYTPFIYTRF